MPPSSSCASSVLLGDAPGRGTGSPFLLAELLGSRLPALCNGREVAARQAQRCQLLSVEHTPGLGADPQAVLFMMSSERLLGICSPCVLYSSTLEVPFAGCPPSGCPSTPVGVLGPLVWGSEGVAGRLREPDALAPSPVPGSPVWRMSIPATDPPEVDTESC